MILSALGCSDGFSCWNGESCISDSDCRNMSGEKNVIFNHFYENSNGELQLIAECRSIAAEPTAGFTCGNDPSLLTGTEVSYLMVNDFVPPGINIYLRFSYQNESFNDEEMSAKQPFCDQISISCFKLFSESIRIVQFPVVNALQSMSSTSQTVTVLK